MDVLFEIESHHSIISINKNEPNIHIRLYSENQRYYFENLMEPLSLKEVEDITNSLDEATKDKILQEAKTAIKKYKKNHIKLLEKTETDLFLELCQQINFNELYLENKNYSGLDGWTLKLTIGSWTPHIEIKLWCPDDNSDKHFTGLLMKLYDLSKDLVSQLES